MVSVALTAARELGFTRIACASTGNLANSVAAHAARVGVRVDRLHPGRPRAGEGRADRRLRRHAWSPSTARTTTSTGCASELAETDEFETTAFVNVNVRPYYAEGSKTLGFEVAEQLGWRLPGAGRGTDGLGIAADQDRQGVQRAASARPVSSRPTWRVFGAQSAGCSPIATAFENGWDVVRPVKPTGIAKSLNIGNPADGPYALDAVRRTGGAMAHVTDDEIRDGIRLLARTTGVFAETAGRRHRRGAAQAGRIRARWTRPTRRSSTTPATGSRPWTRCLTLRS